MSQDLTIVSGMDGGDVFHVHRVGCRDLTGSQYAGRDAFRETHESKAEVVETLFADLLDEHPEGVDEFSRRVRFFRCVRLPKESPRCRHCGRLVFDRNGEWLPRVVESNAPGELPWLCDARDMQAGHEVTR